MDGRYIVFEGPDGSGKSTASRHIHEILSEKYGDQVILTAHPGATALGAELRQLIKHRHDVEIDKLTERLLFLCDNSAFTNLLLKPSLADGQIVLADRSNFIGDYAYGTACGVDIDLLDRMHSLIDCPKADVVVIFDCPWSVCKPRMVIRDHGCRIESRGDEFFDNVCSAYKDACDNTTSVGKMIYKRAKNVERVDASRDLESVLADVEACVRPYLP